MTRMLRQLLFFLGPDRRWRWLVVLGLASLASGLEMIGALLVLSLMALIVAPGEALMLPVVGDLYARLPDLPHEQLVLFAAITLVFFFVIRAGVIVFQDYVRHRMAEQAAAQMATRLFRGYLAASYESHVQRHSSELIRNVHQNTKTVGKEVLIPAINVFSEALVAVALVALLFAVAPAPTGLAIGLFGAVTYVLLRFVNPRLKRLGRVANETARTGLRALQQSLEAFRDIRVLGRESQFMHEYATIRRAQARAYYVKGAISHLPRLTIETSLVMLLGGFIVLAVARGDLTRSALPILGMFAYVSFRMLPAISTIVSQLNALRFAQPTMESLHVDLLRVAQQDGAEPERDAEWSLPFEREIRCRDLGFRYRGTTRMVIQGVDITIRPGESVGVVGPTGGGKTTLIDLLTGLLEPTVGVIEVDGVDLHANVRAWQRNLGVVPQSVVLLDDTLRRNIAFGVPDDEIDEERLREVLRIAQLEDVVAALPEGLETVLGERGVRFSGGQRQRVAIGRALYRDPPVLIFDEGTSALDGATEHLLMEAVNELRGSRTIILVAHRLTTVRACDRILLMADGRITSTGTYEELLANDRAFRALARDAVRTSNPS